MEDAKQQSIMQGGATATIIVVGIFAGITYLTDGAVDWSLIWVLVFITSLPWMIYLYWNQ